MRHARCPSRLPIGGGSGPVFCFDRRSAAFPEGHGDGTGARVTVGGTREAPDRDREIKAEAAKLTAETRKFDNDAPRDVDKVLLAVFAVAVSGAKVAESPDRLQEAIMSDGRPHPQSTRPGAAAIT